MTSTTTIRIGYLGSEPTQPGERHGCRLWPAGIAASITAAEAEPVPITDTKGKDWAEVLQNIHGVVLSGHDAAAKKISIEGESLCQWCHKNRFPILAIDHGMHHLNAAQGGTIFLDLPRDLPDAIQHRHPPERGLRHAINVVQGTHLGAMYGDGEVIVNSEHRRAINRLGRGFIVGATALDGVIEAIQSADPEWWAVGVQWQPATSTASGLDIQLFRGLVEAAAKRLNHVELSAA